MKSRIFVFLLAVVFLAVASVATAGIILAIQDGRTVHPFFWVFTPFLFVVGTATLWQCLRGGQRQNDRIKKIMESTLTGPQTEETQHQIPAYAEYRAAEFNVRQEDEMKNPVSIVGLAIPSLLCVSLLVGFNRELQANTSGEAAAGILAGGFLSLLLVFALSCIPNLACTLIAARRKESLWKLSALGIPACAVSTVLAAIIIK